jgi:hypothetical protein
LITNNDETAYREEVRDLTVWCKDNTLSLNMIKKREMIVDYRKRRTEQVESFKFRWRPHHQQNNMVQAHQDSCEEGTTKPFPPR